MIGRPNHHVESIVVDSIPKHPQPACAAYQRQELERSSPLARAAKGVQLAWRCITMMTSSEELEVHGRGVNEDRASQYFVKL